MFEARRGGGVRLFLQEKRGVGKRTVEREQVQEDLRRVGNDGILR